MPKSVQSDCDTGGATMLAGVRTGSMHRSVLRDRRAQNLTTTCEHDINQSVIASQSKIDTDEMGKQISSSIHENYMMIKIKMAEYAITSTREAGRRGEKADIIARRQMFRRRSRQSDIFWCRRDPQTMVIGAGTALREQRPWKMANHGDIDVGEFMWHGHRNTEETDRDGDGKDTGARWKWRDTGTAKRRVKMTRKKDS